MICAGDGMAAAAVSILSVSSDTAMRMEQSLYPLEMRACLERSVILASMKLHLLGSEGRPVAEQQLQSAVQALANYLLITGEPGWVRTEVHWPEPHRATSRSARRQRRSTSSLQRVA